MMILAHSTTESAQRLHALWGLGAHRGFIAFFVLWMFGAGDGKAQDVHFGQFFNAPLVINPANAGDMDGDQRFAIIHREQWRSLGSPFRTDAFSYDTPLLEGKLGKGRYLGVGVNAFSDRAGAARFGDTQANLSLSYAIRSGEASLLAFGLQGGYGQRSAQFDGLRWDSQYNGAGYDPDLPTNEAMPNSASRFVDFGAGLLAKGELKNGLRWKGGASAFHLNEPTVSLFGGAEDQLMRRFVAHGELRIEGKRWIWLPRFFVAQQGTSREINVGGLLHRRIGMDSRYTTDKNSSAIYLGAFYRIGDAIVPTLQFEWERRFVGAISYDVNISKLRAQTMYRGAMEVSLQYIGVFRDKRMRLPKGGVR
ncbi:MAG: PorP/SprF family type IX secretion system membrane protein [Flavobacteriales bacterium]|nr:PorP/SprF family type IX secretion system membrane protein [Flavobacteriales bacterium]